MRSYMLKYLLGRLLQRWAECHVAIGQALQ